MGGLKKPTASCRRNNREVTTATTLRRLPPLPLSPHPPPFPGGKGEFATATGAETKPRLAGAGKGKAPLDRWHES